jgi:hypothetical protein
MAGRLRPLPRSAGQLVTAQTRAGRWTLLVAAVVVLPFPAAGIADVATGGRKDVGRGTVYGRYQVRQFRRVGAGGGLPPTYLEKLVHIRVGSDKPRTVASPDLYDLIEPPLLAVTVEVEEDTFNNTLSRVRYRGRWYVISSPGVGALFLVVPLATVCLVVAGANATALWRGRAARTTSENRAD